jgi:hypothetical protein
MAVTWLLFLPLLAFSMTKVNEELEKLIYDNIALDRYNEASCRHPSIKDQVYLWY